MTKPLYVGLQFGFGLLAGLYIALVLIGLLSGNPKDDSDPPDGRSGVEVITDHKTGLQYLKAPGGGLVRRIGLHGNQMREGE